MQIPTLFLAAIACLWCTSAIGDCTIRGRVVDESGHLVPGALVYWARTSAIGDYPESIDGKAGIDGVFELTLVGPEWRLDIQRLRVLIYSEGHGLGITSAGRLAKQDNSEPTKVTLPHETALRFQVVDPDGQPLRGQVVEPVNYNYGTGPDHSWRTEMKLPGSFRKKLRRVTDEAGGVQFPAFVAGKMRSIQVLSETLGQQAQYWPAGKPAIELRETAAAKVIFDKLDGMSLGKCTIEAAASLAGPLPARTVGTYSIHFDGSPGFEIPKIAEGLVRFKVSECTNAEPVLPCWPLDRTLKSGSTETIVVPLEKTVTINGRVLDYSDAKAPAAGVYVLVRSLRANCLILAKTDGDGRYRCKVLRGPTTVAATRVIRDDRDEYTQIIKQEVETEGLSFPDVFLESPQSH